jgi:DNA-binding GntR family transcriptional regulator
MVKGTAELQRPVPLYMQVVRQLRAQIASGELAEGDRIPSQREMMKIWRISMQTASKVIGALKTEGLAIPSVGRDTIVAPGAPARIAAAAAGTLQAIDESPSVASYEVTAIAEMTAAPTDVAEKLGIPSGRRALRRQEIHLDNGVPISLATTWFPPAVTTQAPRLADSEPIPAGSFAYLAEVSQIRLARVVEDRAALPADEDNVRSLNVPLGSPVLMTKARHFDSEGQVIAYSEVTAPTGIWRTFSYIVHQ